jgi:hypothetical protein
VAEEPKRLSLFQNPPGAAAKLPVKQAPGKSGQGPARFFPLKLKAALSELEFWKGPA